jgi:hypothetical protein
MRLQIQGIIASGSMLPHATAALMLAFTLLSAFRHAALPPRPMAAGAPTAMKKWSFKIF